LPVGRLAALGPELVVSESTGGLERAAAGMLQEAEVPTAVVNPRQIRDFAKTTGRLAKTDALDAEVPARFAEVIRPEPRSPIGGDRMEFGDPRVLDPGGKAGEGGVSGLREEASCDPERHC